MLVPMALSAKPLNFKWFVIVMVVHLCVTSATDLTGFFGDFPVPNSMVGITPRLTSLLFFGFWESTTFVGMLFLFW